MASTTISRQRPPLPPSRSSSSVLKQHSEDLTISVQNRHIISAAKRLPRSQKNPAQPIPISRSSLNDLKKAQQLHLPQRPHVLHKECKFYRQNNEAAALCDVVVVFSSKCQVSGEWARYIQNLLVNQGEQQQQQSLVTLQDVETFSQLVVKSQGNFCLFLFSIC
jgi:hypothetical protein